MKYLFPNNGEDKFNISEFIGSIEIALVNGYIAVSDEDYDKLRKHILCWENGGLVENHDHTRDDGTEIGLIVGEYSNDRVKRFVDEFADVGAKVLAVSADEIANRAVDNIKFVIWANEATQAKLLEKNPNIKFYNNASAAAVANDKWQTYRLLNANLIAQPETSTTQDFVFPVVVKARHGSLGKQVYLAHDMAELLKAERQLGSKPIIYQEYIEESAGKDMRVICIGGQAYAWYKRVNDDDFRANIAQGGHGEQCELTAEYREIAERTAHAMGLDICGVDILFGADEPLVCEVNARPMVGGIEQTTGKNVIGAYVDYILQRI